MRISSDLLSSITLIILVANMLLFSYYRTEEASLGEVLKLQRIALSEERRSLLAQFSNQKHLVLVEQQYMQLNPKQNDSSMLSELTRLIQSHHLVLHSFRSKRSTELELKGTYLNLIQFIYQLKFMARLELTSWHLKFFENAPSLKITLTNL